MKWELTICKKINTAIDHINNSIDKNSNIDKSLLGILLHEIRRDAQRMESGLKQRKKIMEEHGLEDKYNAIEKESQSKLSIPQEKTTYMKEDFYILIKNGSSILYENKIRGGVLSIVESLENMDYDGNLSGISQSLFFGKPQAYWYAFDQLRIAIEDKEIAIKEAMKELAKSTQLLDPEVKKKLLSL